MQMAGKMRVVLLLIPIVHFCCVVFSQTSFGTARGSIACGQTESRSILTGTDFSAYSFTVNSTHNGNRVESQNIIFETCQSTTLSDTKLWLFSSSRSFMEDCENKASTASADCDSCDNSTDYESWSLLLSPGDYYIQVGRDYWGSTGTGTWILDMICDDSSYNYIQPTSNPTSSPTEITMNPSSTPTDIPSNTPTEAPTQHPVIATTIVYDVELEVADLTLSPEREKAATENATTSGGDYIELVGFFVLGYFVVLLAAMGFKFCCTDSAGASARFFVVFLFVLQMSLDIYDVSSDILAANQFISTDSSSAASNEIFCGVTQCNFPDVSGYGYALLPFIIIGGLCTLLLNVFGLFVLFCNIDSIDDEQQLNIEYCLEIVKLAFADTPIIIIYTVLWGAETRNIGVSAITAVAFTLTAVDIGYTFCRLSAMHVAIHGSEGGKFKLIGFACPCIAVFVGATVLIQAARDADTATSNIAKGYQETQVSFGDVCGRDFEISEQDGWRQISVQKRAWRYPFASIDDEYTLYVDLQISDETLSFYDECIVYEVVGDEETPVSSLQTPTCECTVSGANLETGALMQCHHAMFDCVFVPQSGPHVTWTQAIDICIDDCRFA